jgi:hypothetical protein
MSDGGNGEWEWEIGDGHLVSESSERSASGAVEMTTAGRVLPRISKSSSAPHEIGRSSRESGPRRAGLGSGTLAEGAARGMGIRHPEVACSIETPRRRIVRRKYRVP